jgi:uncharacterized UPF0160 family protein
MSLKRARLLTSFSILNMTAMVNSLQSTKVISGAIPEALSNKASLIGTHDGSFHCDEALACSMLKLLPAFKDATIVRTRNPALLEQCGIVVDVGAIYDPATSRYDHHQREFIGVLDGYETKLSSAGLIYKHYGRDIIREILGGKAEDAFVDVCYEKLYKGFMEHIDAIDNGVSIADGVPLKYHVSTSLSSRVGALNPSWNEEQSPEIFNAKFIEAMTLTCTEFVSATKALAEQWWPARSIVQNALDSRFDVHSSGSIIVLSQACPWKDHLFELPDDGKPVLYALYQDTGGSWRIQAVPEDPNSFISRKKLPAEWCGVRDAALDEKVGFSGGGAIFVHASGFIGGHKVKEGALDMAIKALSM